jgi:SAM-dependent methyltransferase
VNWGVGHCEEIAPALLPASEAVVARAAPAVGECLVDIGCGTGNASLLAAERGARVTGIDPWQRLLGVATERASERKLEIGFQQGGVEKLPLPNASVDVLISVFGVIFAANAQVAAGEMARVLLPGGRIVLSAWIPDGALWEVERLRREAVAEMMRREGMVAGAEAAKTDEAPAFAWYDERALGGLFGPHGFSVELQQKQLSFTAPSAQEFLDAELRNHPAWVGMVKEKVLKPEEMPSLRARALEILDAANEEPDAFRVTSRYVVVTAVSQEQPSSGVVPLAA